MNYSKKDQLSSLKLISVQQSETVFCGHDANDPNMTFLIWPRILPRRSGLAHTPDKILILKTQVGTETITLEVLNGWGGQLRRCDYIVGGGSRLNGF